MARACTKAVNAYGMLCIELFVAKDGHVLVNELAPRPHNSGHYTIEGCYTSQYENHIRAILGLPLGNTQLILSLIHIWLVYGLRGFQEKERYKLFPTLGSLLSVLILAVWIGIYLIGF